MLSFHSHARTQKNSRVKSPTEVMGLAVMKAEPLGCNNSDHVTILQILSAGWCKVKAMDL